MARDGQAGRGRRGAVTDRAPLLVALGIELDEELLVLALTHRSYAYEHGGLPTNERLEFLGDSVLSIVVTERLYRDHPELPEGQLAKLRASVVNMHALAGVASSLSPSGLGAYLYLGRGEELTGGRTKSSILADATEALIGAIYLEHGLETAREVIHRHFAALLRNAPLLGAGLDWKTSLQELTAARELGVPEYRIAEEGPDHLKVFTATAVVGGRELGSGAGRTKKEAEQKAAEIAWRTLTAETDGASDGAIGVASAGAARSGEPPAGADPTPDTERPDTGTSDTGTSDAERPDAERPDAERPDTETSDTERPDTERPDTETPRADRAHRATNGAPTRAANGAADQSAANGRDGSSNGTPTPAGSSAEDTGPAAGSA